MPKLTPWDGLNWKRLAELRGRFLAASPPESGYWESEQDLREYNQTLGERIGWKWDAVLDEIRMRRIALPAAQVVDWGCGSGVASRRWLKSPLGRETRQCRFYDLSTLASDVAAKEARRQYPRCDSQPVSSADLEFACRDALLLVSHVLNELSDEGLAQLERCMALAAAVVWVEPGSRETAKRLVASRERLRERMHTLAPCPHTGPCGLLAPENAHHWCHHFVHPPERVHHEGRWRRFADHLGIDLSAVSYSFLVLRRRDVPVGEPGDIDSGLSRLFGSARHYKGYSKMLNCSAEGVEDAHLMKRHVPEVIRTLKKDDALLLYRWQREDGRITGVADNRSQLFNQDSSTQENP